MTNPKTSFTHMLKSSFNDFKRNKVRTFLTSLGIMVGVMSVVLLIALGLGLKNYLKEQFESLGSNLIIIFPGNVFNEDAGGPAGGFGPGFSGGAEFDEKDVRSLQRSADADFVVPVFFKSSALEVDKEKIIGYVQGTTEDAFDLMSIDILEGERFTKADVGKKSKVAVMGFSAAEKLFDHAESAVGEVVRVGSVRFKIIGVAEKKGDNEMDNSIMAPYTSTFGTLNPNKTFFTIYLGTNDEGMVETVKQNTKDTLLKRYEEDEFSVTEQSQILSTVNQIFGIINAILIAIGSISLFVGGIGIMNIMYATVTERTKEIGIRRAIGATKRDILFQFLSESLILSVLGGLAGLLAATGIVLIIRIWFPASINLVAVLISFIVSSVIGITFGVFPARRAANLSPIEAIRYE